MSTCRNLLSSGLVYLPALISQLLCLHKYCSIFSATIYSSFSIKKNPNVSVLKNGVTIKRSSACLKLELKNTVNLPLLIPLSRHLLIPTNTQGLHYSLPWVAVVRNKHCDPIQSSFPKVHGLILKMKQAILKI